MSDQTVTSMAFYHSDGLVPTWKQAAKFMGTGGHIATLPEIIDARLKSHINSPAWRMYFTTSSAEYFFKSRGGTPILIVAHGVGPMSTLEGAMKAYSAEYKGESVKGGRITEGQFRALEDGYYGEVEIIDMSDLLRRYDKGYPFLDILNARRALQEKLLWARFGPQTAEYVLRHKQEAQQWHLEQAEFVPENRYQLPDYDEYLVRRKAKHLLNAAGDPNIILLGASMNCSYVYGSWDQGYQYFFNDDRSLPIAHLLTLNQLMKTHAEGEELLVTEADCQEWTNGIRFLGVRPNSNLENVHPGVGSASEMIQDHWRDLLQPVKAKATIDGTYTLLRYGDDWFTQYPKSGNAFDTFEPEYVVTQYEEVGEPVTVQTPIVGYHGLFTYDKKFVWQHAPKGANAYLLSEGEPEIISVEGDPKSFSFAVQFYKVTVDKTNRVMKADTLENDLDLQMKLLEKEAGPASASE